jgi:GH24 family phage-related lysozyme (muramidase)
MKTSDAGLSFIAQQESFVGHVYLDIAHIPTIGYGHVLKHGDPTSVTEAEAFAMLRNDVATAEAYVATAVRVPLSQAQFDALVSFAFNLGGGALISSRLIRLINNVDFAGAAAEFVRWDHARIHGQMVEVAGLKSRRLAEAAMFQQPDTSPPVQEPDELA